MLRRKRNMPRKAAAGRLRGAPAVQADLPAGVARVGRRALRGLSHQELRLLHHLLAAAGRPVSRRALLYAVWGNYLPGSTRKVDMAVSRLRAKLGTVALAVKTVEGGYLI